eukprot:937297-Prymnesium_polylepis.2
MAYRRAEPQPASKAAGSYSFQTAATRADMVSADIQMCVVASALPAAAGSLRVSRSHAKFVALR